MQESSGVELSRAGRGDEGRRELRDFRSLQRHCPPAAEVRPTPLPSPNGDTERKRVRDWIPKASLPPKFSLSQTQTLSRRGEQSVRVLEGPRTGVGSRVPVLPRPTRREFEFPRIKVAARLAAGSERGARPTPGAQVEGGPERLPRAMAAPGTSGSAAAVATPPLQLSRRVAGELSGEGEGSGEGKGGERLLVPCACAKRRYGAPRGLLSAGSAPTGRLLGCWPPPCPAAGAKDHQRRAGRSRVPLGRPLAASLSSAATSGARGASQMS